MSEPVIWELDLPEVTIEDVFKAEGADYTKRPPRKSAIDLHQRILTEAAEVVKPTILWREVEISGAGEEELYLEGGYTLTSRLLAKVAGTAEKLIIFTATVGNAFEERVAAYKNQGDVLEAYTLDATGIAYLVKSMEALEELQKKYEQAGLKTTFMMGPGHSYWSKLDDIKVIFELLKPEQIGLSLTQSNLILPTKSAAFVFGVGSNLPDYTGKTHCDFCHLKDNCHMRQYA